MLSQDIRFGLRTLWKSRGVTLLAIVCLGVGIGLNATMFSLVDGVLIQPLPYHEPDRLTDLTAIKIKAASGRESLSHEDFKDIRESARTLQDVGAFQFLSLTLSDGTGEPERFRGGAVSWNLHQLLGIQPILGRAFQASDDVPGAERVVMLSHMVWTARYQADPAIIDKRILLNGRPHTVIGVMPEKYAFPELQRLWVTLGPVASPSRADRGLEVFARLRDDVTVEQAQAELTSIAGRLGTAFPATNEGWDFRVRTLRDAFIPDDVTLVILLMMGGATLVLVIACANVANLLLARATVRRREIAIRASLGAGKGRIVRQLLSESVLLGLFAVPLGLILALIGTALLRAGIPPDDVPYYVRWSVDWRTMLYTIGIAVITAMIFGLMPALHASRGTLHANLKEGGHGSRGRRSWLRNALVTAEVAMALTALVGAMLFVRTFLNLNQKELGFDPAPLMTMRYYLPGEAYDAGDARTRRVRDILDRIERLPGVEHAYSSNFIPIGGGGGGGPVTIEGQAVEREQRRSISFIGITPHFVETIGARITAGHGFTETEGWSRTPLAIVNETMARELFQDGQALGRRFKLDDVDDWFTIIGVMTDVQLYELDDDERNPPAAFVPYAYQQSVSNALVIRTSLEPASITSSAREAIRTSDANIPLAFVRTMDELRRFTFWEYQLFGSVFSSIGVLGLLLASVGVYGVLSYSVSQRRQEIGVMMALGAGRRNVMTLVVAQGLKLAAAGVVVGLAGAAAAGKAAGSLLVGVSPFDPVSFVGVSVFLMLVALAASAMPARRATAIDPIIALRTD